MRTFEQTADTRLSTRSIRTRIETSRHRQRQELFFYTKWYTSIRRIITSNSNLLWKKVKNVKG
mgnify:CR=1 FL=1